MHGGARGRRKNRTYKTDTAGKIIVSGLENGTYIVAETIAPSGYIRVVSTLECPRMSARSITSFSTP
ncbi:MAG: prealbumin-like fold domain-containing protein [Treponema sp.]|nr:prealbumin-like fold domain-containing protein [Treponema sp.]